MQAKKYQWLNLGQVIHIQKYVQLHIKFMEALDLLKNIGYNFIPEEQKLQKRVFAHMKGVRQRLQSGKDQMGSTVIKPITESVNRCTLFICNESECRSKCDDRWLPCQCEIATHKTEVQEVDIYK